MVPSLLNHYGEFLGLDSKRVPNNPAASQFVEALAKTWTEYTNPRAVVMFVVQADERNMGGQAIEWRARLLMDLSYSNRSYHMWRQWVMGNPLPIAHPYLLYKWRHNTGTSMI
ncbi:hypothetical protein Prudu_018341 [Prunus dulcis]|uniref:Uncharacterized protein n=1 Tax=Prunus dulcis TaxID=3755 RepID=A0A4Y1RQJ2_PRUDU|nr:hypothetical protein Prudu_018341 [Prunus dulcis]